MPFLTFSQTTINSESFDSGFGAWMDLNTSNGDASWSNSYNKPFNNNPSIRLRDDSNDNSATELINDLDLTSYSSVEISFDYESEAFDVSDDYFFIEFYNGTNWVEIQRFNFGSNGFINNCSYDGGVKRKRYIPIGLGFFVKAIDGGTITFKIAPKNNYLKADIPVISIPVINKCISCVPS